MSVKHCGTCRCTQRKKNLLKIPKVLDHWMRSARARKWEFETKMCLSEFNRDKNRFGFCHFGNMPLIRGRWSPKSEDAGGWNYESYGTYVARLKVYTCIHHSIEKHQKDGVACWRGFY